jgi:hypothetical protein
MNKMNAGCRHPFHLAVGAENHTNLRLTLRLVHCSLRMLRELATSVYCGFMAYRQHTIDRKWQDYAVSRNAHLHWRL